MQVCVENPVDEELAQDHSEDGAGEVVTLLGGQCTDLFLGAGERHTLNPVHRQHPLGGEPPVGAGDDHIGGAFECSEVPKLRVIVEFLQQGGAKSLGQVNRTQLTSPDSTPFHQTGQSGDDVEIGADRRIRRGALDLHHHPLTGCERGCVHLAERGGGQRLGVELRKQFLGRAPQFVCEGVLDELPRSRGDLAVELGQLAHVSRREQVGAGGEHLTQFHECHSSLGEGCAERDCGPGPVRPTRPGTRAAQVTDETLTCRDAEDLPEPPGASEPGRKPTHELDGTRQTSCGHQNLRHHQDADLDRDDPGDEERRDRGSDRGILRNGGVVDPRVLEGGEQERVSDQCDDKREEDDPWPPHRSAHQPPYRPGDKARVDDDGDDDQKSLHALTLGSRSRLVTRFSRRHRARAPEWSGHRGEVLDPVHRQRRTASPANGLQ